MIEKKAAKIQHGKETGRFIVTPSIKRVELSNNELG